MKHAPLPSPRARRPAVVAAMLLGTALSALGPVAGAAAAPPETALRAVQDISRYCTICWRNARLHPDCWTDCTQEVFVRLLERVTPDAWDRVFDDEGEERREFLRAIDAVKKRTQRSQKRTSSLPTAVPDRHEPQRQRLADDREAVRQAAAELLSPRQQRILQLSFEGWSVQEIAAELHTSPERVSDEKYKAIRKLRDHLRPADLG